MMKSISFLAILLVIAFSGTGQYSRYLIQLKDKGGASFSLANPSAYLSPRAIERRTRYNLPVDSTDLPVTPAYLDSLSRVPGVTVLNASKWLNQVSIRAVDPAALEKIRSFPFVRAATPIAARMAGTQNLREQEAEAARTARSPGTNRTKADFYPYGGSYDQVHIHNGEFLHNIGLRGQTLVISLLDAGFYGYTSLRAFDSVNRNGQVLGTWDFVAREASVVEDHPHGMNCFSIIAANVPNTFIGSAPKARFYLYRTEDAGSEYPVEEHNWVCGAERSDSAGADVISSSLGYSTFDDPSFNHTYAQMNGNTTLAVTGADLAAKKGILVVNAAGNEGNDPWQYISTPADGDSVLAVGAVSRTGVAAAFSSYGPSSDGQVKPDVASVGQGTTIQHADNTIGTGNGTSFACPNIAGLATCLWQGFPELNNIRILNALRQAGNRASTPDNRTGYGIPDVKRAVLNLLKETASGSGTMEGCRNILTWTSKDVARMQYEIERKLPHQTEFTRIALRPGTGSEFGSRTYTYTDSLPVQPSGTTLYRIRQTIDTGALAYADYIDTFSVTRTESCTAPSPFGTENLLRISPNPVRNEVVVVEFSSPEAMPDLWIRIVNAKGQTMSQLRQPKGPGALRLDLPAGHLAKGAYVVSIFNGTKHVISTKMIRL